MKTSDRIPPRSSVPPPSPEASEEQPQAEPEASLQPQSGEVTEASYAWDDIASAPTDGSDIMVRYEGEAEGRLVRWKHGRRFDGRKWITGGRWVPSDSLQPLPAADPTHWARPADYTEPPGEELPTDEAA